MAKAKKPKMAKPMSATQKKKLEKEVATKRAERAAARDANRALYQAKYGVKS